MWKISLGRRVGSTVRNDLLRHSRSAQRAQRSALGLVGVCFALLAFASTNAAAAPDMLTGIEQNGGMGDPAVRRASFHHMQRLGARTIRYVVRFDRVARCDPRRSHRAASDPANGCYDFSEPNAVIREANSRGMRVILSIRGVPRWQFGRADEGYTGTSSAQFNNFLAVYASFVQATARQYSGRRGQPRVSLWTIWNEPNGGYFWSPRFVNGRFVSAARYAKMYDVSARRIKSVDRTMLVAVGPTSPTSPQVRPARYIRALAQELQKRRSPIDAWAHNGYVRQQQVTRAKIRRNEIGLTNIGELYAILDMHSTTRGLPVWITEFAYQTRPDPRGVTHAEQAYWLADAAYVAWRDERIKVFLWYALFDDGDANRPAHGFQSGLFEAPWRCRNYWCPKPAASMFAYPLHASSRNPKAGSTIVLWGKAHGRSRETAVYVWYDGRWHRLRNQLTADGSIWVTWTATKSAWFVTCSRTACGQMVSVHPS